MQTIAEVPIYIRRSEKILDENERKQIIDYLSANPSAGDIINATGGIRKLRWKRTGIGKSGGVRIIYYYYCDKMPLYLLTIYAKGEKDNISKSEAAELRKLSELLKKAWGVL